MSSKRKEAEPQSHKNRKRKRQRHEKKESRQQDSQLKEPRQQEGKQQKGLRQHPTEPRQEQQQLSPFSLSAASSYSRPQKGMSKLQEKMRRKLEGGQFRMINERLYTSSSRESVEVFKKEPQLFDVYHRGFREQVGKWPVHPLDVIIEWLRRRPKAVIADFGCGEARLAASIKNKCHSFDLCSPNELVTACDMANVPLPDGVVDVAVFCLSLMGTNMADFLREAFRVLKVGGTVKVAEVRSRFEGDSPESTLERFLELMQTLGFRQVQVDRKNRMFVMMEFVKTAHKLPPVGKGDLTFSAKACTYKKR